MMPNASTAGCTQWLHISRLPFLDVEVNLNWHSEIWNHDVEISTVVKFCMAC
jgi:hypothetical protein